MWKISPLPGFDPRAVQPIGIATLFLPANNCIFRPVLDCLLNYLLIFDSLLKTTYLIKNLVTGPEVLADPITKPVARHNPEPAAVSSHTQAIFLTHVY